MEIKQIYANKFKNLTKETEKDFTLRQNLMLVEKITLESKTKSGIVLATNNMLVNGVSANSLDYHVVVKTGEGYEDADGNLDPDLLECKAGNIVVLPTGGVNYLSYFGTAVETENADKIGIARTSDCFMIFKDEAHFKKFFEELG